MAKDNIGNSVELDGVTALNAVRIGTGVPTPYSPAPSLSAFTGTPIWAISATSFAGVAQVVQGSASSFSVFVWSHAKKGDFIQVTPGVPGGVSSLSSGLVLHSHCTQDGQVEIRWSNVSTLAQNQSAITYNILRMQAFI